MAPMTWRFASSFSLGLCLAFGAADRVAAAESGEPPQAKADVKIEGRISVGFEAEEFKNGRSYYDAEVEFETKRRQGTRGVASFRGKSKDTGVVLEDAYIDHKIGGGQSLHAGQTKKILGLEYSKKNSERLTIERSPIYKKMEEFAYVGREMTLRWEQEVDLKSGDRGYQASLGYSESIDANVTLHVEQPVAAGDLSVGGWLLLQSDRIDAGRQMVYATVLSVWTNLETHRFQFELIGGKDPFMSEYEQAYGDAKPVHFWGAKAQYGLGMRASDGDLVEPLVQTSLVTHDADMPGYNTIQLLLGLNYWMGDALRIAFNVEGGGTNSPTDSKTRAYNDSNAAIEATYYF